MRAAQGAGAAMLQANSVALVTTSAPPGRLRTALGIQAAAQAIGLAIGPTVGGLIVQTIGWRWVFALNVPVGVIAIVAGRYLLPRTRVTAGQPKGTAREVLRTNGVLRALIGALLAYLVLFGPIVLVPAVLQDAGRTPLLAGLVAAALPVGFALGAGGGERLLPRAWSSHSRCVTGIGICLGGLAVLVAAGTNRGPTVSALAAVGGGLGIYVPANNADIMSAVPTRVAAVSGGMVSTARAIGTAGGTALVAGLLAFDTSRPAATGLVLIAAAILAIGRRRG
jgi:MFS family permease